MNIVSRVLVVSLASLSLGGCTMRLVDFTALSSKNCDVVGTRGERTQGKDMTWSLMGIPLGGMPNMKEATDRAIERCGGDILVDGVVYLKYWNALVLGQTGYVIEGTCVNTKRK